MADTPAPDISNQSADLEIKSILLLDDDVELADTLKLLLESRNYVVTSVKNGVEGLHEIMAFDFDLIMCDMMMPSMPGDMFYLAVQRTKPHLCSRFIFVTAHGENPRVGEFLATVNSVVLYKPVNSDELIRMMSFVLNQNQQRAEADSRDQTDSVSSARLRN